ncbi:MAG: SdpI family protein [Gemmatimonadota bacterium]|nr:SdpI family protein [Gemmatimonadota bacterium]
MRKWIPAVAVVIALILSVLAYPHLPDPMPSHWDAHGRVNGTMGRFWGAFLLPLIMVPLWALLRWLPSIDPRRANYARFQGTYDLMVACSIGLLALIHVTVLAVALGYPIRIDRVTPIGVGLLFVVIGNLLPRARPNWFFGIRTPWTLSNDRVWERTHRVGGYLMLASGVLLVISGVAGVVWLPVAVIACVLVMTVGLLAYSYVAWKQETGS